MENIVDYILKKMNKNNYIPQDINLFKYGLNIFIRYIIFFLTIFFITSFCGNFINVLLFDFTLIVLRFHCGGYHSENIYTCFFLSVFAMAVLPQILVRININKVINFFITELFIMLQIIKKPIKNIKKIYDKQFIKKMEIRKTIILVFLNKLFKYATDMNLYDVNPMQYYKVQNDSNRYLVEWDFDTLNTIFELCKGTRLHMFLHCFFGTDLKMNEILALKWDDLYIGHKNIKKNNCYAVVNKKLKRKKISYINEHRENIIKQFDPKINDEGSTRLVIYKIENSKKIHIPINVAKMLIKWKKVEGRKYQISYEEYENNDLVFSLLNGKACEDRIINKEFDKLKYENNLPDVKMSRLEFFSKERIIYKEEVMTIRDFYYRTLFYDYSEYFEIGYIKSGLSYNNNIIPIGTNYRSVNLKDINVPKKKEIDLSKMISLIKNNSSLSNELTSILKE